jgi:hypothetical protein
MPQTGNLTEGVHVRLILAERGTTAPAANYCPAEALPTLARGSGTGLTTFDTARRASSLRFATDALNALIAASVCAPECRRR